MVQILFRVMWWFLKNAFLDFGCLRDFCGCLYHPCLQIFFFSKIHFDLICFDIHQDLHIINKHLILECWLRLCSFKIDAVLETQDFLHNALFTESFQMPTIELKMSLLRKSQLWYVYVWLPRNNIAQIVTDDGMVSYDDCFGQWS